MSNVTLTDARVRALTLRKTAYDIRDRKLRGFGVRMLPSGGKRFFVHCQHRGERVWEIVGDAGAMSVADARSCAAESLAAIRRGENVAVQPDGALFEAVAETMFQRYERLWKAGTLKVNRGYLRNQLMPHFKGRPISDIDRRDVRNWFAALRATPVAADRSMPVLSVIMKEAEAMGLRTEGFQPPAGASGVTAGRGGSAASRTGNAPHRGGIVASRGSRASRGGRHPSASADGVPQE